MAGAKRIRESLKTRDLQRAARRLAEMEDRLSGRPRKTVAQAIVAFNLAQAKRAPETKRKYGRILRRLADFCEGASLTYIDKIGVEELDPYQQRYAAESWTWIKEVELLRQFFGFCIDREWTSKNPAKSLHRPRLIEANDVEPYKPEEVIQIIAACDGIGRTRYERLRARAMVLVMRYTGMRVSDVVTLSREHIRGNRIEKRAIKNGKMLRVNVPPEVLFALETLPRPKEAAQNTQMFLASGNSSLRTLVKAAERTMSAVFKRSGVARAHCHRFRHTLASELLGKGVGLQDIADILGDSPATVLRHYAKWTPERQARQDSALAQIHGTNLAQAEEQVSKC